jgi:hypothetical protein
MLRFVTRALLVLTVLALPPAAFAQADRGTIRGTVRDASRTPVSLQDVRVVHEGTNEMRTVVTDATGQFAVSSLVPGDYRIEIERDGYKKYVGRVTLHVNQNRRVMPVLEVGSIAEEIVVTAPLLEVRRDSAALGAVIENRQITTLPLDGRNFLELSLLVPGAVPAAQGSAGSVRGDFAFNVNGAREDSNAFLLDGAYNIDPKLNSVGVKPPVDAIREFEVLTGSYDASFGRNAGGHVNVVLKSGTNRFSGSAYEFFRNGALDARNFFAPDEEPAPEYNRNQFGFSIGGPVARDRTFFFADYEGTRSREGITRVTNVPTLAERRGDFSQSLLPPPINPLTGQPFPGNRIPDFFLNPIGVAIAALYPEPNRSAPFANFVSSPAQRDRQDQFDVRIDHRFGGGDLMARYSFADRDLFDPFSGPTFAAVPGFGTSVPRRAQHLVVADTRIFSSMVHEARVAFGRVSAGSVQENQGASLNRLVGLPELSSNPRDAGLSFVTVPGFSPLGDERNNPQHSTTNSIQFADNLTWTRGAHLVKAGFELRATRQDAFRDVESRGFLTFLGVVTGNPLADLLLGYPVVTGGARLDNPQRLRSESYSLFVHDTIRAAPSLTLSAGVRYEIASPPVDADDRATLYDPSTGGLVAVGTNGVPRSGYATDRNNVAPRVGFAWTPAAGGATVVRGNYGIYYDQTALAPGEGLYFSAPYFDFNLFFPLPGLPLTLADPFPATFPFPLPDSATTFQRDLRTPYFHHFTANVQQQLGRSRMIEAAYVGSRGRNLITARDINQPAPSPVQPNLRPNPFFDDITEIGSRGSSRYDALQLRFQQRLDAGLSVLTSYTLGKSTDNASGVFASAGDPNFPQDSRNLEAERGRSNFDVRHRLSIAFSYDLPFGRGGSGWTSRLAADWSVHGIVTLQSGRPFTVALLSTTDNSNTGRSTLGFGANDRPNQIGDPSIASPGPDAWFNTAAFALPPFGTFGDVGRNTLDGPGYRNVNLSLVKHVGLGGAARLQLRAEAFNLFNRVNFDLPDNFLGSPTFGRILSAQSPRHIQFGVRLLF